MSGNWLDKNIRNLHPVYFSLVMATGIVSIAAKLEGFVFFSQILLWLNVAFYLGLWLAYGTRLFKFFDEFKADCFCFNRSVGFFTVIAGSCVLGSQFNIVANDIRIATYLWCFALVLFPLIFYGIFTCLTISTAKPGLEEGINGGWLVAVVACQGLSLLGSQIASQFAHPDIVIFIATTTWMAGGILYVSLISLIFYRSVFLPMTPQEYTSPYWINMGAVAISTLAGTQLVLHGSHVEFVADLLPFIKGLTLLFWATAFAWLPQLIALNCWRFLYKKHPFRYSPMDWGMVFPLGMFTVCTIMLAKVLDLSWLQRIPEYFIYIAILAWCFTLFRFIHSSMVSRKQVPAEDGK